MAWDGSDLLGLAASLSGCLLLKLIIEALAERKLVSPITSRKIMHIGAGVGHVATWPLYTSSSSARWLCAAVPLAMGLWYAAVALGLRQDRKLLLSATRTGRRQELVAGALYGVVHAVLTLYWRTSSAGIVGIAALCAGDGVAELAGRRFGHLLGPLPHNHRKTIVGTSACAVATFLASAGLLWCFNSPLSLLHPALPPATLLRGCLTCALAAAAVESLPLRDVDNVVVPLAVAGLAGFVF